MKTRKTYTLKDKIPVYIGYFTSWIARPHDDVYDDVKLLETLLTDWF
jgi:murein L,D-transpeptidase YcbB/YkuD